MTPPAANVIRCLRTALGSADGGPSDAALVERFAKSRDPEAFELLVWRHAGMVLRVCRSRLHDHHAAEDASQAVFLALAKQAAVVSRRGTVAGWLYRVAWRVAAKAARKRLPQIQSEFDQIPAREGEPTRDPALVQALNEEIARLPEKYRVPLLLCFFEGLSHADAAQRLGWPMGTLASRIARAKSLVHRRLTRRGLVMPAAGLGVLIVPDPAPAFVNETVRAAVAFVSGTGVVAIPTSVLQLAQGAIRTMTLIQVRWAAAIVAACGAMTIGIAWAASTGMQEHDPDGSADVLPAMPQPAAGPAAAGGDAPKPEVPLRNATNAQRQLSLNNLKQILLAIHNYDAAHGYLPSDILDKTGKPLLSWRVAILPFMDQENLYRQFKLDQAWDSEHNLKLLAQMPRPLRVGIEPKDATHTYYQVFAGPGTPFGPGRVAPPGAGAEGAGGVSGPGGGGPPPLEGSSELVPPKKANTIPAAGPIRVKLAQISDGTSNTFGVVEAGPAVPWSKPADLAFDPKKPLPKLEGPFANAFHIAMMDGSAHALKRDIEEKVLRNLIMMDDGNPLPDLKTFAARRPAGTPEEKAELKTVIDRNAKLIDDSEKVLKEYFDRMRKMNAAASDFTQADEQMNGLLRLMESLKGQPVPLRPILPPQVVPTRPMK